MGFANFNAFADMTKSPHDWVRWENDFHFYLATDWVITETGSGTRAVGQIKDGVFVVTNAAADNDVNSLQLRSIASGAVAEHWKFVSGKKLRFAARFKISDATQSDFVIGLHITATAPVATPPTDGIFFRKDDGDRLIDFCVRKNDTASTATGELGRSGYMTDDTYTCLEFIYDGGSMITAYQDGVPFGSCPLTNVPDDEELAVSFAHQNGTDAAKVLSMDYIGVWQERGT